MPMWVDYGLVLVIIGLVLGLMRMQMDLKKCLHKLYHRVNKLEHTCETLSERYSLLLDAVRNVQGVDPGQLEVLSERINELEGQAVKAYNQSQKALSLRGVESRRLKRAVQEEYVEGAAGLLQIADTFMANVDTSKAGMMGQLAQMGWLAMGPGKKLKVLRDIAQQRGLEYGALKQFAPEQAEQLVEILNSRYDDVLFPPEPLITNKAIPKPAAEADVSHIPPTTS